MSRPLPLIALLASIALLAGLAASGEPVCDGSRTQQLRAADQSLAISTSVRARSTVGRRDRAQLDVHTLLAATTFTLVPPDRIEVDLVLPPVPTHGPGQHRLRSRSRAPPRS